MSHKSFQTYIHIILLVFLIELANLLTNNPQSLFAKGYTDISTNKHYYSDNDGDDSHDHELCYDHENSNKCKLQQIEKKSDQKNINIDAKCLECQLTGKSIDDLIRRPRQVDAFGHIEDRIDLDKIKKLVCRDYIQDDEREKCRDFYFSNLPIINDWKESKPRSSFQDYVCIQRLKYCCPAQSFGPKCKKCLKCNSNEKCLGEGSRTGNGTCVCKDGHSGPNCSSCLPGYYSSGKRTTIQTHRKGLQNEDEIICKPCHRSCLYCRDEGQKSCEVCKSGFTWIPSFGCSDIDECVQDREICGKKNTFCVNTEGSYFCYDCDRACDGCHSDGPDNCIRCSKGYTFDGGACKAPQPTILKPEAHYARYAIYLGLGISSLILYSNNIYLAGLVGLVASLYAGGSEYFMSNYLINY